MYNLILFGGSFDPPHLGHLNTAVAVQNHIQFERFLFLPCKTPVLKKPTRATCDQRVHMLKLALESHSDFKIDLREIQRKTPSFMVNTLESFRDELGHQISITLLLGMDAFLQLPQWHAWKKILELSNLIVMNRVKVTERGLPDELRTLLEIHEIRDKAELLKQPFGKIYQYNAGEYDISSTALRHKIEKKEDVQGYLSNAVYQYIKKEKLYVLPE